MDKQTYTIGDIHGELKKLKDCISKVPLQKGDRLIFLGDYVDRGPDSYLLIEYLISLKEEYECIFLLGNHDESWLNSLKRGEPEQGLLWRQGAKQTHQSYLDYGVNPEIHFDFLNSLILYYIDEENNYFVHGGFNRHHDIKNQPDKTVFTWDRDLFHSATSYESMKDKSYPFKIYGKPKEVFIGHTPTVLWEMTTPIHVANLWNVDTGCGKGNYPLTILNIKTKEYYQSYYEKP